MRLLDLVETRLAQGSRKPIWRFPEEQKDYLLSELLSASEKYSNALVCAGVKTGDRVGIMLRNCSDYIALLLGTWKAGAIAVPLRPHGGLHFDMAGYLSKIEDNCNFRTVIFDDNCDENVSECWARQTGRKAFCRTQLATIANENGIITPQMVNQPTETALIQYSSGSTGDPKGIIVTHDMIAKQVRQIDLEQRHACNNGGVLSSGSWLPFNHDLGLFIGILHPLFVLCNNILVSPHYYMYKPKRWFVLQAQYEVDWNFSTNLAMANSFKSLAQIEEGSIDLSKFFLYLAAEKVSPVVLKKCWDILGRFGMPCENVKIAYGIAENTLGVASTQKGKAKTIYVRLSPEGQLTLAKPDESDVEEVVAIGEPHVETHITICNEEGTELPELWLGEIHIKGPCVTPGYYRNEKATKLAISEGILKTRDLGFRYGNDYYFFSRKDDVLVVGGRNIAPEDIEECAETVDGVLTGGTALIDIACHSTGKRELVLLVETSKKMSEEDSAHQKNLIQKKIMENKGLLVNKIFFAGKNSIEKTSSGKKRRKVIRDRFVSHQMDILFCS